jgi:hypothetical protein
MQFKTATRTAAEIADHKTELDRIFKSAVGHDKRGKIDPKGMRELEENKIEIAQLVVQLIEDTVAITDPTPFMVDRRTYNLGDQILFQELRGDLKVTKRAYGSKALSQRLSRVEWGMQTAAKEVSVEIALEEIASGAASASDHVNAMAEAINRHRVQFVLDGIDAGIPAATQDRSGVAGFTLRYSGLTKENLERALDGLKDDGEAASIFARHTALYPAIRAFDGWSDEGLREFEQRGVTGVFQGSPVVTLVDKFSRMHGNHVIRNDRIYISGGSKGAVLAEVDLSFLNYAETNPRVGVFTTGMRMEEGLLVWNPYAYRIIEVSG